MIRLRINGEDVTLGDDVDPTTPVLWVLRDHLGLTGTKFGCGMAQCGSCTIHLDGKATRCCLLEVGDIAGRHVTTIEGLSADGSHPVQQAWVDHGVAQCGYCQVGQIMSAAALLEENPAPTEDEVIVAMGGNICRCGTYQRIRAAIQTAAGRSS